MWCGGEFWKERRAANEGGTAACSQRDMKLHPDCASVQSAVQSAAMQPCSGAAEADRHHASLERLWLRCAPGWPGYVQLLPRCCAPVGPRPLQSG